MRTEAPPAPAELARTLVDLSRVAKAAGANSLAAAAQAEHAVAVERIGSEVGGLPWAAALGSDGRAVTQASGRLASRLSGHAPNHRE